MGFKKTIRLLTVTAIFLSVCSLAFAEKEEKKCADDQKVEWMTYEDAVKKSAEAGVPSVLVFYSDSCRKCEVLEEKGFNRAATACYVNEKFAPARIKGDDRPDLKKKFKVSYYPLVWFIDPEGKEIDYFVGYVSPERLDLILHYVGDGAYKEMDFDKYEKQQFKKKAGGEK